MIALRPVPVLALGAIVAELMYGVTVPVLELREDVTDGLADGTAVRIARDGTIRPVDPGHPPPKADPTPR